MSKDLSQTQVEQDQKIGSFLACMRWKSSWTTTIARCIENGDLYRYSHTCMNSLLAKRVDFLVEWQLNLQTCEYLASTLVEFVQQLQVLLECSSVTIHLTIIRCSFYR